MAVGHDALPHPVTDQALRQAVRDDIRVVIHPRVLPGDLQHPD